MQNNLTTVTMERQLTKKVPEKVFRRKHDPPEHSIILTDDMAAEDNNPPRQPDRPVCPSCGGSGHLGLFRGESRFMISWEECYECDGTGYIEPGENDCPPEEPAKSE